MRLRIGQVATRSGVTPRTIRYYEELGLLPASDREQGKHRTYTEADIERLQRRPRFAFIVAARDAGVVFR